MESGSEKNEESGKMTLETPEEPQKDIDPNPTETQPGTDTKSEDSPAASSRLFHILPNNSLLSESINLVKFPKSQKKQKSL